jgi:hypothetical protein
MTADWYCTACKSEACSWALGQQLRFTWRQRLQIHKGEAVGIGSKNIFARYVMLTEFEDL